MAKRKNKAWSKGPSIDAVAVHRVRGGSAPSPLARTRSGNPRPKASPVTIRRGDGSVEILSAKEFSARHGAPSWVTTEREYAARLRAFRAGEITQAQLRAFAEAHGFEQRLQAALERGAGGGRLDAIPQAGRPGTSPSRSKSRNRPARRSKRTKPRQ